MKARQTGAALLAAMLTVTLVASLAAAALWQQWRSIEVESAERARQQSLWVLTGALDWARLILREDARSGGADHLAEPWAIPLAEARMSTFLSADQSTSVDNDNTMLQAFLSGGISDLQARMNVRNLVDDSNKLSEPDLKAFAKLFGEYLRVENVLQNYDEFASLRALQDVDMNDPAAVEAFKDQHNLSDDDLAKLQEIKIPADRKIQDYRSTYNDVRDWLRREKSSAEKEKSTIDWDDVVFEVDLLKSQEINLDYILELIFEHNKKVKDKAALVEDVRRVIRASVGNRAKEGLLVDFINQTDLDQIGDKASVIDAFFTFAQAEQQREAQELISDENLNAEAARRYITTSLKREFASDNGTELNAVLPKMSPLNPQYLTKKQSVFQKIGAFVEKFKGVGGQV